METLWIQAEFVALKAELKAVVAAQKASMAQADRYAAAARAERAEQLKIMQQIKRMVSMIHDQNR